MSPSKAGRLRLVGDKPLLRAHDLALTHDERVDTLGLDPIRRGVPSLDIAHSLLAAAVTLTIEGASTLELQVHDPGWLIERSGLLNDQGSSRLAAAVVTVDELRFRLVKATRQDPDVLTLVFEDEVAVLLRQHNKPLAASRGSVTRGEFIERMVRAIKARDIPFWSPEGGVRFPDGVRLPDLPDTRPAAGQTGFDDGVRLKIKGVLADAEQMRQMATALGVADQEDASPRARLAMVVAGIGESSFRDVPNTQGTPYAGVFQARKDRRLSTAQQARYFLRGGQGFQSGGAIAAARRNPGWSAGTIAYKVEGNRSNFPSDAAAEHFFQQHAPEARRIIAAWGSGDGAARDQVTRVKAFQFTRGEPGKKETSWDAAVRLAEQVRWRFFAMGGVAWFVSDDYLISLPGLEIEDFDAAGLLEPPTYDWDHGKVTAEVQLRVAADRWALIAGAVIVLRDMGPVTGRWIISRVEMNLFDATETTVSLVKPMAPLPEPAAEIITRRAGGGGGGGGGGTDGRDLPSGAGRAIAWARSKIGRYKEEFGQNRGRELDRLERSFGFTGAPWCAMFVTTALVEGGVSRDCRSASVAQIRGWAEAGTHGYQKGYRATPKPGDLMCFGTAHIAFVEKVNGTQITTIEGNTSANQVARRTRVKSTGVFVRPDYPN